MCSINNHWLDLPDHFKFLCQIWAIVCQALPVMPGWTQRVIERRDAGMFDSVLLLKPLEPINGLMKLYWIESRLANSTDAVSTRNPLLFPDGIKIWTTRAGAHAHLLPWTGWSQKFKTPAGLILSPSACTSKDVWVSSICLQRALTGVLLCGTIS